MARAGSMAPAEFDRIWFLRMRTLPRLSLTDKDDDDHCRHAETVADCDRLLPSAASSPTISLTATLRLLRTTTTSAEALSGAHSAEKAATSGAVDACAKSEGGSDMGATALAALEAAEAAADQLPHKKSRWRTKAGNLCNII